MKKTDTIHAAKPHLSRLVERAERGDEIILAGGSAPLLTRLRRGPSGRRFGAMRGRAKVTCAFFEPLSPDEAGH